MACRAASAFAITLISCAHGAMDPVGNDGASGGGASGGGGGADSSIGGYGAGAPSCTIPAGELDRDFDCDGNPPGDAFEPVLKWSFSAPEDRRGSVFSVLVGNLTDDDASGTVDLCDVPDIVVVVWQEFNALGTLYVLSGDDGHVQSTSDPWVTGPIAPALGDIDGDHVADIVAVEASGRLVAFDGHLQVKWRSSESVLYGCSPTCTGASFSAIALHDLEADGYPEILVGTNVYEHDGQLRFRVADELAQLAYGPFWTFPTIADLDGDGDLTVLFGSLAYDREGEYRASLSADFYGVAYPVDIDGDGAHEVVLAGEDGMVVVREDGTVVDELRTADAAFLTNRFGALLPRGAEGHDLAMTTLGAVKQFRFDGSINTAWSVTEPSELNLRWTSGFSWDGMTTDVLASPYQLVRSYALGGVERFTVAPSQLGHPFSKKGYNAIVADADGDGSADLVVPHGYFQDEVQLEVFEDIARRPLPARRIWNQAAYMPGAVTELGDIVRNPDFDLGFRTQGRRKCAPPAR